jgi:hypothetical protein
MSFLRKVNESTQLQLDEPLPVAEPAVKPAPKLAAKPTPTVDNEFPFLSRQLVEELRKQWEGVQAGFVDEPREAVRQADELLASAIEELVESFAQARANLEGQLSRGGQTNTEDLRVALKKYRSFFQKLMTV